MATFGPKSRAALATCDPRLVRLFEDVVQVFDCIVLEGARSREQQIENVAAGVSKTMDSRHLDRPLSHAADVAPYPLRWPVKPKDDSPAELKRWMKESARFYLFAGYVLARARALGIPLTWGGDWDGDFDVLEQNWDDLPHFEIPKGI